MLKSSKRGNKFAVRKLMRDFFDRCDSPKATKHDKADAALETNGGSDMGCVGERCREKFSQNRSVAVPYSGRRDP